VVLLIGFIKLSRFTRAEFSPKNAAGLFLVVANGFFSLNGSMSHRRSFKLLLFCLFSKSLTGDEVTCWADLLRLVMTSNSSRSEPGVKPPSELFVCRGAGAGNYKEKGGEAKQLHYAYSNSRSALINLRHSVDFLRAPKGREARFCFPSLNSKGQALVGCYFAVSRSMVCSVAAAA